MRTIRKAHWQEFCYRLEPRNTKQFWKHSQNLFRKRHSYTQDFVDEDIDQTYCEPHATIHHVFEYYSTVFRETETLFQNPVVAEFQQNLPERLSELPSKTHLFKISDLLLAIP